MSFTDVSPRVSFPELEQRLLSLWSEQNIFEKTLKKNEGGKHFVFYEGPPTANGMPHPGHVLTRAMKDVFLRYHTMLGEYVPRRAGWDTHGLPVEVEVEKALGISGRDAIQAYGVEEFTHRCIESVFKYIEEWRKLTTRVGFWVDLDAAYVTFHKEYVESVWWALSELFKKGLLYQDYKVVWWWPQGGTALSAGEVGQGYQTVDDPSVFVKFESAEDSNTSFVAWTTTPWTLPSNVGLAVGKELEYSKVKVGDETFIIASSLVAKVMAPKKEGADYEILSTLKGSELVGQRYKPLFDYEAPQNGDPYRIVAADFVTLDSGSGIVHMAPAFGEDDFRAAKENNLGFLQLIAPDGNFVASATDFAGRFCKEADRDIIRFLKQKNRVIKDEVYRHEYPYCWRKASDPLIQYARKSWYVRTTSKIDSIIENNRKIHWEPEHIQEGRFGQFLAGNVDWALSRERFWGTPLPIWINDVTGNSECLNSAEEIISRNPKAFDAFHAAKEKNPELSSHLMVHKPWIDHVTYQKAGEEGTYRRVSEVIDGWFDSGCMPFAQHGYPHKNHEAFAKEFPADFITEAIDQTRGWFYSLLAVSSMVFEDAAKPHPFKNCVVLGIITDDKAKKLSKSLKNYNSPDATFDQFGADAVRWALYAQSLPGQTTKWFDGGPSNATKDFLLKVWNCYSFFVTYAKIDGWTPNNGMPKQGERAELDRWILAELDKTTRVVAQSLDAYRTHPAARVIGDFVESLSNWYVRRSRSRFWASGDSNDKASAFATLYEVLVQFSKLIAPFTPFVADALYQNLVVSFDSKAPASVHLCEFPKGNDALVDAELTAAVEVARMVVTLGSRVRAERKLKVRQPLSKALVVIANDIDAKALSKFESEIKEELNVDRLDTIQGVHLAQYVDFTVLPNFKLLGAKLGKEMAATKAALLAADGSELFKQLEEQGSVRIVVNGNELELTREEVEVRLVAKEGFAAAADRGRVVLLDTNIDEELRNKGLAREVVSKLQGTRKVLDLPFEARIEIELFADDALKAAVQTHQAYIENETLAVKVLFGTSAQTYEHDTDVDGLILRYTVREVGAR